MDRAFAVIIAVATAFHLLATSAEQPMARQTAASASTTKLALSPAGHHHHQRSAAAMAGEEQRLPFVAAQHLPAASWPHGPVLWAAGSEAGRAAGELGLGGRGKGARARSQGRRNEDHHHLQTASDMHMMAGTVEEPELPPEPLNLTEPWLKNHCLLDRHDFSTGSHEYNHMLYHVNVCLLKRTRRLSSYHWVLCPEPKDPNDAPCGYVIIPLRGLGDECTLAFRADNLDLAAFANGRNKWHVFKRYANLMPTAIVLDFDNDYKDLKGTEDEVKMSILLGGTSLLQSSSLISMYMKAPGSDDKFVKWALSTLAIGIKDVKRFTPLRELVVSGWLQGTTLNKNMVKYLSRWRELSCELLKAEEVGAWGTDEYSSTLIHLDIAKSKQDALDIVDVLSSDCA